MGLARLLQEHRVICCVGSGGVGKTTTAAALAVDAAMSGKHVLCLTIDPARRLANSLGLTEMRTEEQEVPAALFEKAGLELTGSLSAMMLDTKGTFDELVARNAPSPAARDRLLENRLYQYVSTSLAGTQEYMAMEKLHAVREDPRWDLIVLDTPPTSNALDFLDAPDRMVDAIDSPATRWFIQAFEGAGKLSFGMVGKGAAFLLRGLAKFTGGAFLEAVAELVTDMNDLFGGFRKRAAEVSEALRSPEVAFVIVTSPSPLAMREALFFAQRLADAGMAHDGFVVNAVHRALPEPEASTDALVAAARAVLPEGVDAARAVQRMRRAFDDEQRRAAADRGQAEGLRMQVGRDAAFAEVPAFEADVHDLRALARVARYLTEDNAEGEEPT